MLLSDNSFLNFVRLSQIQLDVTTKCDGLRKNDFKTLAILVFLLKFALES